MLYTSLEPKKEACCTMLIFLFKPKSLSITAFQCHWRCSCDQSCLLWIDDDNMTESWRSSYSSCRKEQNPGGLLILRAERTESWRSSYSSCRKEQNPGGLFILHAEKGPLTRTEGLLIKSEQGIHRAEPLCQPYQYLPPRHCLRHCVWMMVGRVELETWVDCEVEARSQTLEGQMLERQDSKVSKPCLLIDNRKQSHASNQSSQQEEHAPE
ncbi:uncharacterized protein LOC142837853 [Microtus pennsylvanicus]|uniref:uncharacterized protein LOC142837853 n=1 Tax=Microtus pennsylvanicus TaxID=10058 RepID=UPI003F6D6A46